GPGGEMQDLPPLQGDSASSATAINDRGDVVGISGDCFIAFGFFSARHALLWHDGVPTDLGNFGGKAWNTPTAMNNQGVVVGFSDRPGDDSGAPNFQAFVWTKTTGMQKLPQLSGETRGGAFGINDNNQIVGQTKIPGHRYHATLWQNGTVVDLNTVTPPGSPYLIFANEINNDGVLAGAAVDPATGQVRAYAAYPVP